jgi:hexokinase
MDQVTEQERNTQAVVAELQKATNGEKTSYPFLRNPLPSSGLVKTGDIFQVLVVGGSVCKSALIRKDSDGMTILARSETSQPPFLDSETFFTFLRTKIISHIPIISLNFAYPLTPLSREGRLDGVLVAGMKENTFEGLVGKPIGEMVEREFPNHRVVVANDTICTLLAGLSVYDTEVLACGIVGTGVNFAYFDSAHEAINLEAANFAAFTQSPEGQEIDSLSSRPGSALFEKETGGAYLYQHFNLKVKKLGLNHPGLASTLELKQAMYSPDLQIANLARALMTRSAKLIASQIAGITRFKKRDMVFVMEGSLFWEGDIYRPTVEETLKSLLPTQNVLLVHLTNSPITGAAELATR